MLEKDLHRIQNLKTLILYFYRVTKFLCDFVHKVCGGECDLEHIAVQKKFLKVFREAVKVLSCCIQ